MAKGMTDEVWWQLDLNWRHIYLPTYRRWRKHNLPPPSVGEVINNEDDNNDDNFNIHDYFYTTVSSVRGSGNTNWQCKQRTIN